MAPGRRSARGNAAKVDEADTTTTTTAKAAPTTRATRGRAASAAEPEPTPIVRATNTKKSSRKVENTTSTEGVDEKVIEPQPAKPATKGRASRQKKAVEEPQVEAEPEVIVEAVPEVKTPAPKRRGGRNTKAQTAEVTEELQEEPKSKPEPTPRATRKRGLEPTTEAAEEVVQQNTPPKRRKLVEEVNTPARSTRKPRGKANVDLKSIDPFVEAPAAKPTRGRKAAAAPAEVPEPVIEERAQSSPPAAKPGRGRGKQAAIVLEDAVAAEPKPTAKRATRGRNVPVEEEEVSVAPAKTTGRRRLSVGQSAEEPVQEEPEVEAPKPKTARGRKALAAQKQAQIPDEVDTTEQPEITQPKSRATRSKPTAEIPEPVITAPKRAGRGKKIEAKSEVEEPLTEAEPETIPKGKSTRGRAGKNSEPVLEESITIPTVEMEEPEVQQTESVDPEPAAAPEEVVAKPTKARGRKGKQAKKAELAEEQEIPAAEVASTPAAQPEEQSSPPKARQLEPQVIIYTPTKPENKTGGISHRSPVVEDKAKGAAVDEPTAMEVDVADVIDEQQVNASEEQAVDTEMADALETPKKNAGGKRKPAKKGNRKNARKPIAKPLPEEIEDDDDMEEAPEAEVDAQLLRENTVTSQPEVAHAGFEVVVPAVDASSLNDLHSETPLKSSRQASARNTPSADTEHAKIDIEEEAATPEEQMEDADRIASNQVEEEMITEVEVHSDDHHEAEDVVDSKPLPSDVPEEEEEILPEVPIQQTPIAALRLPPSHSFEYTRDPVKSPIPSSPLGRFSTPLSKSPMLDPAKSAAMSPMGDVGDNVAFMGTSPGTSPIKNLFSTPSTPARTSKSPIASSAFALPGTSTPTPQKAANTKNIEGQLIYTPRADIRQLDVMSSPVLQPPSSLVEEEGRSGKSPVKHATPRSSLDPLTAKNLFGAMDQTPSKGESSNRRANSASPKKRQSISFADFMRNETSTDLSSSRPQEEDDYDASNAEIEYYPEETTEEDLMETEYRLAESGFYDENSQDEARIDTSEEVTGADVEDEETTQVTVIAAVDHTQENITSETAPVMASEAEATKPSPIEISYVNEDDVVQSASTMDLRKTMGEIRNRTHGLGHPGSIPFKNMESTPLPELGSFPNSILEDVTGSLFNSTNNTLQNAAETSMAKSPKAPSVGADTPTKPSELAEVQTPEATTDDKIENEMLPAFMTSPEFSNLDSPRSTRTDGHTRTPIGSFETEASPLPPNLSSFNDSIFDDEAQWGAPPRLNRDASMDDAAHRAVSDEDESENDESVETVKGKKADEPASDAATQSTTFSSPTPKSSFSTVGASFGSTSGVKNAGDDAPKFAPFVPPTGPPTSTGPPATPIERKFAPFVPPTAPTIQKTASPETRSSIIQTKFHAFVPPTGTPKATDPPQTTPEAKIPPFIPPTAQTVEKATPSPSSPVVFGTKFHAFVPPTASPKPTGPPPVSLDKKFPPFVPPTTIVTPALVSSTSPKNIVDSSEETSKEVPKPVFTAFIPPTGTPVSKASTPSVDLNRKFNPFIPPSTPKEKVKATFAPFVPPTGAAPVPTTNTPTIDANQKFHPFVPPTAPQAIPQSSPKEEGSGEAKVLYEPGPEDLDFDFSDEFSFMPSPESHNNDSPGTTLALPPPPVGGETPIADAELAKKIAEAQDFEFSDEFSYIAENNGVTERGFDSSPLKALDTPTRVPRRKSGSPLKRLGTMDLKNSPLGIRKGTPRLFPKHTPQGTPTGASSPRQSTRLSPIKADKAEQPEAERQKTSTDAANDDVWPSGSFDENLDDTAVLIDSPVKTASSNRHSTPLHDNEEDEDFILGFSPETPTRHQSSPKQKSSSVRSKSKFSYSSSPSTARRLFGNRHPLAEVQETGRPSTNNDTPVAENSSPKRRMSTPDNSSVKKQRLTFPVVEETPIKELYFGPTTIDTESAKKQVYFDDGDSSDVQLEIPPAAIESDEELSSVDLSSLPKFPATYGVNHDDDDDDDDFKPEFLSTPKSKYTQEPKNYTIKDFFSSPGSPKTPTPSKLSTPKKSKKKASNTPQGRRLSYLDSSFSATIEERQQEEAGYITPSKDRFENVNPLFADCPDSVQAKRRGRRTSSSQRRKSLDIEGQHRTFTKIQAACRGWLVRNQPQEKTHAPALSSTASIPKHMEWAAEVIVSAWRGRILRQEYMKQRNAAICIQRAYRQKLHVKEASNPAEAANTEPAADNSELTGYDNVFGGMLRRFDEKKKANSKSLTPTEPKIDEPEIELERAKTPEPEVEAKPKFTSTPRARRIVPNSPVPAQYLYQRPQRPVKKPLESKVPVPVVTTAATSAGSDDEGGSKLKGSRVPRPLRSGLRPPSTIHMGKRKANDDDELLANITARRQKLIAEASQSSAPTGSVSRFRSLARLPRPTTAPTPTTGRLVPGNISLTSGLLGRNSKDSLAKLTQPEVNQLTTRHTNRNKRYLVDFERTVVYLERTRSPSPDAKKQHRDAYEARLRRYKVEEEKGITLGPGDPLDFEPEIKPPTRKGVRWAESLETGYDEELERSSPSKARKLEGQTSIRGIIKRKIPLDAFGNVPDTEAPLAPPSPLGKISIKRYVYKGEYDVMDMENQLRAEMEASEEME